MRPTRLRPVRGALAIVLMSLAMSSSCLLVSAFDFSEILGRGIALIINQVYVDGKDMPEAFKMYAMHDRSNEDIGHAFAQDIIERSGYNYENHYVISDDGYITELVRIVNPLADRKQLKQPPVLLQQGGITDITIWLFASSIQHHPEPYPRKPEDGIITSWNRSLAFTLANNGYDVWLAPTRGRNDRNTRHVKMKRKMDMPNLIMSKESHNESQWRQIDAMYESKKYRGLSEIIKYWDYTMDDIAAHEVPRQIEKVLEVTGSKKLTLFPMSFSTIHTMLAMAKQPRYLKKLHNAVLWGPISNNKETNLFMFAVHNSICKWLPSEIGALFFSEFLTSQLFRDILLLVGQIKEMRYSLISNLLLVLAGPSAPFQTLLDPGVYGHVLMNTGFKEVKQYCQIVTAGKFLHYDFGLFRNKKVYGQMFPPKYETEKVDYGNWLLVSGEHDKLATMDSVQQYIGMVKSKPFEHILVKGYNHLDLWAGVDNDIKINLPVLSFLDNFHLPPIGDESESGGESENELANSSSSRSMKSAPAGVEIAPEKPPLKRVIDQQTKRSLARAHGLPPSARALQELPRGIETKTTTNSTMTVAAEGATRTKRN